MLGAQECARQVDGESAIPILARDCGDKRSRPCDPRVIYQNINAAKLIKRRSDKSLDRRFISYVCDCGNRAASLVFYLLSDRIEIFFRRS